MGRIGGAMAPVKCEENRRTLLEIKPEPTDHEANYEEPHAERHSNNSVFKQSSSSLSNAEAENSYEFLGHMKYEADELSDFTTTEPASSEKRV